MSLRAIVYTCSAAGYGRGALSRGAAGPPRAASGLPRATPRRAPQRSPHRARATRARGGGGACSAGAAPREPREAEPVRGRASTHRVRKTPTANPPRCTDHVERKRARCVAMCRAAATNGEYARGLLPLTRAPHDDDDRDFAVAGSATCDGPRREPRRRDARAADRGADRARAGAAPRGPRRETVRARLQRRVETTPARGELSSKPHVPRHILFRFTS